jgi:hypothetical protein
MGQVGTLLFKNSSLISERVELISSEFYEFNERSASMTDGNKIYSSDLSS